MDCWPDDLIVCSLKVGLCGSGYVDRCNKYRDKESVDSEYVRMYVCE